MEPKYPFVCGGLKSRAELDWDARYVLGLFWAYFSDLWTYSSNDTGTTHPGVLLKHRNVKWTVYITANSF